MDLAYHTFLRSIQDTQFEWNKNIFGERGLGNWPQEINTTKIARNPWKCCENVCKCMLWLRSGHPQVTFDGQLAQLVEHLTEYTGVSCSNPRLCNCIFSIPDIFYYTVVFFSFLFFTKIFKIFKSNQMMWFHNLKFNLTIYKYKIRHKKYDVGMHTFSKTRKNFVFLYNVYDVPLKISKAFFKYWHERWYLFLFSL
jgi:hypothetical protein